MSANHPLFAFAEEIANRILRLDADTLARLGDLQGKVICLEITNPAASVYLLPSAAGFRVLPAYERKADVVLRATLPALLKLGLSNGQGLEAMREVEIAGNLEVAQRFQRILQKLDLDWEEFASRLFGDVIAHRLGNLARGGRHWLGTAGRTIARDFAEYLQEERRILPAKSEAESFFRAVDVLRGDADRLERRVRLLERQS